MDRQGAQVCLLMPEEELMGLAPSAIATAPRNRGIGGDAQSTVWDKKMFYGASPLWNGEGSVAVSTLPLC